MAGAPDEDPPRTREVVRRLDQEDRPRDLPLVAGHDPDPAPDGAAAPRPEDDDSVIEFPGLRVS
jgi:hypothetical protein